MFLLCITSVVVCAVPVRPGVSTSQYTSRIIRQSLGTDALLLELDSGSSSGHHDQHNSPSHKLQLFLYHCSVSTCYCHRTLSGLAILCPSCLAQYLLYSLQLMFFVNSKHNHRIDANEKEYESIYINLQHVDEERAFASHLRDQPWLLSNTGE